MAEIIINTKEVIKRKSYYPDFINIIINSKEFIIPTYKESASVDDIDNIVLKYEYDDNDYTITIQFEDTKDYVKCALSIITCIRSVREQVYITGECNVY